MRNADNDHLAPTSGPGYTIGHVDEVNGNGARRDPRLCSDSERASAASEVLG
jgi:hypothetical protein